MSTSTDCPPMRFRAFHESGGPWHDFQPETLDAPCGATVHQPEPSVSPGSTFATVETDPQPRCPDCAIETGESLLRSSTPHEETA